MLIDKKELANQEYDDLIQSSFTKIKSLSPQEKRKFKLFYLKYLIKRESLIRKAFLYFLFRYPSIVTMQIKARQDGGLSGKYQWLRLAELVWCLKRFKPTSIVEMGSGTSTALFSKMCPHKLTTLEESEYWKDRLLDNIKDLSKQMNLIRADRVVEMNNEELVCYYDFDHTQYYDFVYVDGPHTIPPEEIKNSVVKDPVGYVPCIDVELFWDNNIFPRVIIIDGKRATVRRLIDRGKQNYNIYLKSDFLINCHAMNFSDFSYHTMMIRKD